MTPSTARYRCSTTPRSTGTPGPLPAISPLIAGKRPGQLKAGNHHGVSPTYRRYCRPTAGTASATCRPGTGIEMSSIYRDRTDKIAPSALPKSDISRSERRCAITRRACDLHISGSGWPDLNRRPLRPEGKFIGHQAGPTCGLSCCDCPWLFVGVRARTWRSSPS
jgi:hypothetical protein